MSAGLEILRGSYEVNMSRIRPVLYSYFERTRALTGTNEIDFDGVPSFGLTNEKFVPAVLRRITGAGGAYAGVGAIQSFVYPAITGASHAFAVDKNASVPFGFVPFWGLLYAMSPTRAHFMALLLSRVIGPDIAENLKSAGGEEVIREVEDLDYSGRVRTAFRDALQRTIAHASNDERAVRSAVQWYDRIGSDHFELLRIYNSDTEGLLTSEEAYQQQRELFLNGLISGMVADWASHEMNALFGALKATGLPLGLVFISNLENWFPKYHMEPKDMERINALYGNLERMSRSGSPLVISSIDISEPRLYDLQGFIARTYATGLPAGTAAPYHPSFVSLREMVRIFDGQLSIEQRLEAAYASMPYRFMKPLLEHVRRIFRDNGNRALKMDGFERALSERSDVYRNLPPEVRNVMKLNMMDMGVISPPALMVYGGCQLMRMPMMLPAMPPVLG